MDFWQRARSFADEAAKKSQGIIASTNLSDVVSEASKLSKEFAAEASKKSKEFAAEALKRADQITAHIPPALIIDSPAAHNEAADLEMYGVTDDLREFVKGITINTFQDFPLEEGFVLVSNVVPRLNALAQYCVFQFLIHAFQLLDAKTYVNQHFFCADDSETSDIPMVSNVRQDLTEWQERHAKLVLLNVKEISKLRYQLCPRIMKERKFWRIYFILVKSHVEPYEKRYMEDFKLKAAEKVKDTEVKEISSGTSSEKADEISKPQSNDLKSEATEKDLDAFLLGDLEDSDDGPGKL
ncbi:hypothetical protein BUALT_Bualt07G0079200 [Buddleja alternifolia]|uniref:BSD domain-containing protein n=1 Tax=Buddleja alternifolia TaxID=168488 RepID=A0AAV6XJX5_9LAMI|nr:hypothetical protein BUALT_Bualt07G0079200 [Buddleja alternifolia]